MAPKRNVLRSDLLPEHVLRLMDPRDRPKGNGGLLAVEAIAKGVNRSERDEQRIFYNWLLLQEGKRRLSFDWSRTDKATTRRLGTPDFILYGLGGRTLFLEFKLLGGNLSPEQEKTIELLIELGHIVAIPKSAAQAIELTNKWINI